MKNRNYVFFERTKKKKDTYFVNKNRSYKNENKKSSIM